MADKRLDVKLVFNPVKPITYSAVNWARPLNNNLENISRSIQLLWLTVIIQGLAIIVLGLAVIFR